MNTYTLVGAGGTGSIVAPHLLRHLRKLHYDAFRLLILDGDTVSVGNTARQDFNAEHIGRWKAEVLAERLGPNATSVPVYIDAITARKLIQNGDTVLIAVDNYRARADIEKRALELPDITIINAGNEATTASCQIFIRRNGQNLTPPISFKHPEILTPSLTREEEGCMVHAESPDHEQTVAANMMSAAWMLAALAHLATIDAANKLTDRITLDPDTGLASPVMQPIWHELHADLNKGKAGGPDWRDIDESGAWRTYQQPTPTEEIAA